MEFNDVSALTEYASKLATNSATESLKNKATGAQSDAELLEACKEFETYLWEQVVKSMKDTVNITGTEEGESKNVEYFMDSAISDVAKQMTEQSMGGNSLAMQMYEQMKRNQAVDLSTLTEEQE
ncbi:MAG TPA: hypothetical protein PLZ77_00860 [Lachnospiraceae bacterium]|nr:hypothetical protein [Lachnospiraceae bacterium]HPF28635.1 hypothetical protein [Lachnospiraceae bacterium]